MYVTAALPSGCPSPLGCTNWNLRPQGFTAASDSSDELSLIQLVAPPGGLTASDLVVSLTSPVPTGPQGDLANVSLLVPGDQGYEAVLFCSMSGGQSSCATLAGASAFIPEGTPFFLNVATTYAVDPSLALNGSWKAEY